MQFIAFYFILLTSLSLSTPSVALTGEAELVVSRHGDHVVSKDYGLVQNSPHIYKTLQGKSECHCRSTCIVEPECKGVSYDSSFMCSFTSTPAVSIDSTIVSNQTGSSFVFWVDSFIAGSTFSKLSDGLTYALVPEKKTSEMVLPLCMNLPGFRATVLTDSSQGGVIAEIITALGDEFIVGLQNDVGEVTYINRVPFGGSVYDSVVELRGDLSKEDEKCFRYKGDKFELRKCHDESNAFVCQAIF